MTKRSELETLMQQVDIKQEELLQLLEELVAFKTPSPPARNTADAQAFVADYLRKLQFDIDQWEVYPGDPNVVGILRGTAGDQFNSLIINGHIDVAELDDNSAWKHDPFQLVRDADRVYGRGVADMKGGLAGALFALRLLHEAGVKLPGDLIFQSVIGEEVGEAGTKACCDRGYKADFAVVVDTSECHIQGQGGVITGWITVKSPQTYHDATRRRMIHAGGGLHAASAIEKMAKLLSALHELERHWAVTKVYPGFPAGANTINPAVIEGGRHAAFVADACRLWITVHFYPNENHHQVAQEIEDYLLQVAKADPWMKDNPPSFVWGGASMIEERGEIFPSLEIDPHSQAVKVLAGAHEAVFKQQVEIGMSATVTDGGWLGNAGIPTVIYGPGDLQNAHAVNESASIDELLAFTKVMVRFIYEWCHKRKEHM